MELRYLLAYGVTKKGYLATQATPFSKRLKGHSSSGTIAKERRRPSTALGWPRGAFQMVKVGKVQTDEIAPSTSRENGTPYS